MKRHPALQDLSRDHQLLLLHARHVRWAAEGDPRALPTDAVIAGLIAFWDSDAEPHLREEETVFLPAYAAADVIGARQAQRIIGEHAWLSGEIDAWRLAAAQPDLAALARFAQVLHDHVRFEEREAFERAQAVLDETALADLAARSAAFRLEHRGPDKIGPAGGRSCAVPPRRRARADQPSA